MVEKNLEKKLANHYTKVDHFLYLSHNTVSIKQYPPHKLAIVTKFEQRLPHDLTEIICYNISQIISDHLLI